VGEEDAPVLELGQGLELFGAVLYGAEVGAAHTGQVDHERPTRQLYLGERTGHGAPQPDGRADELVGVVRAEREQG